MADEYESMNYCCASQEPVTKMSSKGTQTGSNIIDNVDGPINDCCVSQSTSKVSTGTQTEMSDISIERQDSFYTLTDDQLPQVSFFCAGFLSFEKPILS